MIEEIKLPKLGESIVNAIVVKWLKKEGDKIAKDEPLLEVSTDKVNSEIPAPSDGVLEEILAFENTEVDVGGLLARMRKGEGASEKSEEARSSVISPVLLRLLSQAGQSPDVLSQIQGTGEGGRVTKRDVEEYLESKKAPSSSTHNIDKLPMCGIRKAIAENMVKSFYEAPHASLVAEIDVTKVMQYIKKTKDSFFQEHGVKLTLTSYLVWAMSLAVQNFPMVNASVDQDTILIKRFINLGIAVSVENGVVVPVIQNSDQMDIPSIAKKIGELSYKARHHQLTQEEVSNGTITMTNFGMSGMLIGVPIIRYPEVAIVGIGGIHKRVQVLEDDTFAIRQILHATLTFDHRVLDGIYGANFLNHIKHQLETAL